MTNLRKEWKLNWLVIFSDAKEALSDKQLKQNLSQKSKMSEMNMWTVMSKNVKINILNYYLYHNIFGFVVKKFIILYYRDCFKGECKLEITKLK